MDTPEKGRIPESERVNDYLRGPSSSEVFDFSNENVVIQEGYAFSSDATQTYDVPKGPQTPKRIQKPQKPKRTKAYIIVFVIFLLLAVGAVGAFMWLASSKTEEVIEASPMAVLFVAEEGNSEIGDLYISELNKTKTKVASDVWRYGCKVLDDNSLLYITGDGDLYLKRYGVTKEKIADGVGQLSYDVSADGKTILYPDIEDEELYLYNVDSGKQRIGSLEHPAENFYKLSADGNTVYYCDGEGDLYVWTEEGGDEKIASQTYGALVGKDAFYCASYNDSTKKRISYIKLANESDTQKIDNENMTQIQFAPNGMYAMYLDDYSYEDLYGELYIYLKNNKPIKIASAVSQYSISEDGRYVYFVDADGVCYVNEIPEVDEETYKDFSSFREEMDKHEKIRLAKDVESYKISPNGKNVAILDVQNDLYISKNGEKASKVSNDVKDYMIGDKRFCYLTGDGKLYLNCKFTKTAKPKEGTNLIALNIKNFACSKQGEYIVFRNIRENTLNVCIDGQQPRSMIARLDSYDYAYYKNQTAYENIIEINNFVGKYKNDELGFLFEIRKEGEDFKVDWYVSGELETSDMSVYGALDRYTLSVKTSELDTEHSLCRLVEKDGIKRFGYNNMNYAMVQLSEDEFQYEIESQILLEDYKVALDGRRDFLAGTIEILHKKGKQYCKNGVEITTTTPVYSDHDEKNLLDGVYYDEDGLKKVKSYYVSNTAILWLELSGTYRGDNVWIKAE